MLPSYEQLFGDLDFREGDEARSVYSPAAYLVDLLRLLESAFEHSHLLERRADLKDVVLDAEHTFTESPYLDIVNEVLERLIGQDPYGTLRTLKHPFCLPFSLENEQLKSYLHHLQVEPETLYRLFGADEDVIARLCLGLSEEDAAVVTTPVTTETELREYYGGASVDDLQLVERFRRSTGLSAAEVRELTDVTISPDEQRLLHDGGPVPFDWFERANRTVRLAERTRLSLTDLYLVLTTCCAGRLDKPALRTIATATRLMRGHDLTMADVCGLAVPQGEQIGMSEADIAFVVQRLEPGLFDRGKVSPQGVPPLQRVARLVAVFGVPVAELFGVLDALAGQGEDPYQVLRTGDGMLALAEELSSIVGWMQDGGFGAQELNDILGGRAAQADPDEDTVLENLAASFEEVALAPELFVSSRFGERAAEAIHDVVSAYDEGVVSPRDPELIRLDRDKAAEAAYDAITQLGHIAQEDFQGLGLDERLTGKIFANLVFTGYLDADGTLNDSQAPLAGDFEGFREALFKLIGTLTNGTSMLYPSDLGELMGLERQAELYDNLVFNGYLDSEGEILDPEFFQGENADAFAVNADLADVAPAVLQLLEERRTRFKTDPLVVDVTEPGLLESLHFNGYINQEGKYVDKAGLLNTRLKDFNLAIEFYPRRRQILESLKEQVADFRKELYTFVAEDFTDAADEAFSRRIIDALDGTDLGDGPFLDAERAVIEQRIAEIMKDPEPYSLDLAAITELGFADTERDALVALLTAAGNLDEDLAVPEERLGYFHNVGNALDFTLSGMEDYSKDVFFLLHAVATELTAGTAEIVEALERQADKQRRVLFGVLADAFGVPTATAQAICVAVTGGQNEALDELTQPQRPKYRRMRRFALLAAKLGLSPEQVEAIFQEQDLVEKYPESLALPPGVDRFDALLDSADGNVYLFGPDGYWTYVKATGLLTDPRPKPHLGGLARVEAAFVRPDGEEWLVGGAQALVRAPGGTRWAARDQVWGKVRNAFDDMRKIDAAFVDKDGRTYVISGDQYVRYSTGDYTVVDEGFPRTWEGQVPLFQDREGRFHYPTEPWGRIRNVFEQATSIAAAYTDGSAHYLVSGDQVVRYSDDLENDGVCVDDGYPQRWRETGVQAAFKDANGVLHLIREGDTWGTLAPMSGTVDAAFVGLDGRTYLFSGDRYLRYTGDEYTTVDQGYPRSIAGDWGGLTRVDAAFVLDGTTYLFSGDQYVRYSTKDYRTPDTGYPRPLSDNWWNIPGFTTVDAVFTGRDGLTYLFDGDRFVVYDSRERWWSEPRRLAEHWDSIPFTKVDAAFAGQDGRTYVFSGSHYVRYSGSDYTEVDDGYPAPITGMWGRVVNNVAKRVDAALVAGEETYLFSGGQYVRYHGTDYRYVADGYPRALSDLGTEPRLANLPVTLTGVDAALADRRNVCLFSGTSCHVVSDSLHARYDVEPMSCAFLEDGTLMIERSDGWVRSSSIEGDIVSAEPYRPRTLRKVPEDFRASLSGVLKGADGNTYLFKGTACYNVDQARAYPLAEEWGRQRNTIYQDNTVDAAFVGKDGKTYLFSGDQFFADGGDPRPIEPTWGLTSVRLAYVRDGKNHLFEYPDVSGNIRYVVDGRPGTTDATFWGQDGIPDAVLFEGDTMLLVYGKRCLPYDERAARGSYPRPIEQVWHGLRPGIKAAFTATDGSVCFFYEDEFTRYADGVLSARAPIRDHWGLPPNPITTVDAAVVHRGTTYLFSGDRYVRYSTADYQNVDPGYPKPITGNLRKEETFANLPESFEDDLTDRTIDAVVANDRTVYVFVNGACHAVSRAASATYDLTRFGRVRNVLVERGRADAALVTDEHTFVLAGDQYVRYTGTGYQLADEGYPRAVDGSAELGATGDGFDAAFFGMDGRPYFFAGKPGGTWGRIRNAFADSPGLDGACTGADGALYAFRGDQYVRYTHDLDFADPGYPRTIKDDWGDLPQDFEAGIDGAFAFDGHTYLVKGERYVRDRAHARTFRNGWADAADHRLNDVRTISAFARLDVGGFVRLEDPYQFLAERFGWDVDEIRWARRNSTLLPRHEGEIEFLLRLAELFAMAGKLGKPPSKIYGDGFSGGVDPSVVHDELNVIKRDVLVPTVIAQLDLHTSRELFERYLIDVDMGSAGRTSRVREAIAATQLYLHRCLLDLEQADEPGRERLKTLWRWMKNYRVWEANRKVFLYPENYLRPELRASKTPAFEALESDLLQGEITPETVQKAYKRYLDEYTEVSRLAIAGGYVYQEAEPGTRRLVLFGRTRTEPRRFYYRGAEFRDGEKLSATWGPWLKVDLQIDAEKVQPVHAFGRVFVFWTVVEAVAPETQSTTITVAKKDANNQTVSAPAPKHRVKICYSFYNLNQEWVAPQVLPAEEIQDGAITGVTLFVEASRVGDHDSIMVTCTYTGPKGRAKSSYVLTPELYAVKVADADPPVQAARLDSIFAEPVDQAGVARFNSPDEAWLSVDHKGGSFLCRPITPPSAQVTVLPLKGNEDGLPTTWDRVDAAVELPDGTRAFFDNQAHVFVLVPKGKTATRQARQPIAERWGIKANNLTRTGVVDAVLVRGNQTFLFSGNEYYRYTNGKPFGPLDTGYPQRIETNPDNLPQWSRIDAAVTWNGIEYFFSRERGVFPPVDRWPVKADSAIVLRNHLYLIAGDQYVRLTPEGMPEKGYPKPLAKNEEGLPQSGPVVGFGYRNGAYFFDNAAGTYAFTGDKPQPTRDLGKVDTNITRTGTVDAAYVDGGKLYLTSGTDYVRYTLNGTVPDAIDDGYPKTLNRPIKAVFSNYAFSGGDYAVLSAGAELDVVKTFNPVSGNWGGLPDGFTGALDSDKLFLFTGSGGYARYSKTVEVPVPYELAALPHEIIRLTSSTAYKLNRELLTGGVDALLDPATQETDELPAFSPTTSNPTTIQVRPQVHKAGTPASTHLDFQSANGIYYWEIFFHAPLLIAGALNEAQRFEDARHWYDYVFDPTEPNRYWRFLPFLEIDVAALVSSCRSEVQRLAIEAPGLEQILAKLETLAPAFQQVRDLTAKEVDFLQGLAGTGLDAIERTLDPVTAAALLERLAMVKRLRRQYALMGDRGSMLKAYLEDPFDPHAIAELRPGAYRRAVVMSYVDNLLDWGDMLFRQYTGESIDEARMLYIFAYDLLGDRPENLGTRALAPASSYGSLDGQEESEDDKLWQLTGGGALLEGAGAIHGSIANRYFFIPDNTTFAEYWTRVEDRLWKIRQSLDITGVSQPVPLFEPPADVMSLVRGAAAGVPVDQLPTSLRAAVPSYRFAFLFRKAQDLVDRVTQLGNDLLSVLERRDQEELTLLQNRQEAAVLALTRQIKEAQVRAAAETLQELEAAKEGAAGRVTHFEQQITDGMTPYQQAQIENLTQAATAHFVAAGLKIGSAVAFGVPEVLLGAFILGTSYGGEEVGQALDKVADVTTAFSEAYSVTGELMGLANEFTRLQQDWNLQLGMAKADFKQLGHQVAGAEHQLAAAKHELEVTRQEIANQEAIAGFLRDKFGTADLYRWMSGRLSTLYFQAYHLAYEMARSAERAYQFERGAGDSYIQPVYWDSRRSGLLAGESLSLDLERLGKAYVDGDGRGLEITKRVSLLALDPLAVIALRTTGRCEFALTEALFDRDFPGHYRRRIRTVTVTFEGADGPLGINATLTQLDNKLVLAADAKAVKYLLDPKGTQPDTLRADWRTSEQIALSDLEEGRDNNGLFELRFDDDRYLPFEGTGAVSRWRVEMPATAALTDVTLVLKYTAEQGGALFAQAVKGMLRPYQAARYLDVATDFPDAWDAFTSGEAEALELAITPQQLPGISGRQITGVFATYQGAQPRFLLNGDRRLTLTDGKLLATPGLSVGGQPWILVPDGDTAALTGVGLVLTYRAV
ncbi:hemopexin repeat-containing protein [Nonomuraea sediminis]|uniref:hemopexin repeat-containing protein n=1 Tax=Nonomuraea sediminis TaxID=2835864 RepID=UPI001BDCCA8B|nr:hemopexin repeat-containing protein [Nonomuraea sediminis]